ncbi:MAG: squalene--hopene cyclase [Planctomycetia bacterium]|nr:squalene--hopene cyclase [Planctomycetia bacterium]
MTPANVDRERLIRCCRQVRETLLAERTSSGNWEGELSASALSTATAVMALEMVRRASDVSSTVQPPKLAAPHSDAHPGTYVPGSQRSVTGGEELIARGIEWLAGRQNSDGGWGDTTRSVSNISTTMLCHAAFHATGSASRFETVVNAAAAYIDKAGGVAALRARYGKDKTFSIPILTHCALAGLVDWRDVAPLPFELACIPAQFYKWARLPVVSYALPALIAIGQVRHHFVKPWNPLVRIIRGLAIERCLAILEKIQPASGGFLEATPLTSFVTMSLAGMGRADHPVARNGAAFLKRSARPDGSWPIDTNLATWVTTLSINALGSDLPRDAIGALRDWLLGQQYRVVHPYTNADPGGWAWTNLPGGVPDADDTPGAILALLNLEHQRGVEDGPALTERKLADTGDPVASALESAVDWLLDLQNGDGGWPTFCRGWGTLPFDRSAPDLTAHALRALGRWTDGRTAGSASNGPESSSPRIHRRTRRCRRAIMLGFEYLSKAQRDNGSWLPLWFGNQHAADDENPTYGTARVLAAYRDAGRIGDPACSKGLGWLCRTQNPDGGWGGAAGILSSTEETSLAVEVLVSLEADGDEASESAGRGVNWLLDRFDQGKLMEPSPIGFYFAKLWYFEKLYPLIFATAALRRAVEKGWSAPRP